MEIQSKRRYFSENFHQTQVISDSVDDSPGGWSTRLVNLAGYQCYMQLSTRFYICPRLPVKKT